MITARDIARAEFIVDSSEVVDILINGYRTSKRGRPANRQALRLMLIGLFLSIHHHGTATLAGAEETLLRRLPLDEQVRLGIVMKTAEGNRFEPTVSIADFYNLDRVLKQRLAYTLAAEPDLDDSERQRRRDAVQGYGDALIGVFNLGWSTKSAALDATGVWSWGRGVRKKPISNVVLDDGTDEPDPILIETLPADMNEQKRRVDVDAGWGVKTSKNGKAERFFGYHEHTLVQISDGRDDGDTVPALIVAFELTAANEDIVDVSLAMIDRTPLDLADLAVDRHYHFKTVDRWKKQLDRRNIAQHHDLRVDEHGFTESASLRWAAGWAHCPATPDALGSIPPMPFSSAPREVHQEWQSQVDLRESYAMRQHDRPDENGKHRVQCPALAGKIGCPLRPGTGASATISGLPIVENPPVLGGPNPAPLCCTQRTVRVTPPANVFKLQQRFYWGSKDWARIYSRRSLVEGSYGNRKNVSTENLRRGQFQIFGLVWVHIVMGLNNASYNLRMLENWCERHPDATANTHPLIAVPDADRTIGFVTVDPAEWDLIHKHRDAA
jgi:hypothetical protein